MITKKTFGNLSVTVDRWKYTELVYLVPVKLPKTGSQRRLGLTVLLQEFSLLQSCLGRVKTLKLSIRLGIYSYLAKNRNTSIIGELSR
jgi:hypothetical protein